MKTNRKEGDFDCLAFKDQAQAEMLEATRGSSRLEFREYLQTRVETGPFADFWRGLTAGQSRRRPTAGKVPS